MKEAAPSMGGGVGSQACVRETAKSPSFLHGKLAFGPVLKALKYIRVRSNAFCVILDGTLDVLDGAS